MSTERPPLPADAGNVLLAIARAAIAEQLGDQTAAPPDASWLAQPGACFVTLTKNGELRGCIGSLEARRPLVEDVRENARNAAFRDPRFPALTREEFGSVAIEISLLSPSRPLAFSDEADAVSQLRPGIDGVTLEYGYHRGTFLPQVWENIPDPIEFLANLKYKAGLPPDFWDPTVKLSCYTVTHWKEAEPAAAPA